MRRRWTGTTFSISGTKLMSGDLESGLAAASAVGDDRIQKETMGRVHPESFTHGTSAQRVQWFSRGYERGDAGACETFN